MHDSVECDNFGVQVNDGEVMLYMWISTRGGYHYVVDPDVADDIAKAIRKEAEKCRSSFPGGPRRQKPLHITVPDASDSNESISPAP